MSGQILHLEPDPHVAVQRLLPWYLTGRLDSPEHEAVEAHLAACPECRAELETERRWQAQQLLQPASGACVDVEAGWARMRARLADGDTAAPARMAAPAAARSRERWRLLARGPARAWAAPAALGAALAVGLMVALRPAAPAAVEYRALAAPPESTATAVVRFRPDATEAQIRQCLVASGARLVDGPTVTAAYVVRLPREHYAQALDKLRHAPGVLLVEALEGASP